MKYNCSYYNIVLKKTDRFVYLYNSFSGALCKLEKEIYELILKNEIDDKYKCNYFDELLNQGLIKPVALNEYNKIILNEQITILSQSSKSRTFVIAPTLSCNLNCDYCFENGFRTNKTISDQTIKAVAEYIKKDIDTDIKAVNIGWFGGEPLIAYSQIIKFNDYFKSLINKRVINYTASMITNGVLLDKEKVEYLSKECSLKRVQITVDGTEEVYCKRKRATIKQYNNLIKNIKDSLDFVKVSIRLNCDGNNYDDLKIVAKQLVDTCGNHKNLNIYLAKLIDYAGCRGEKFLSQIEFDNKRIEFDKYICELMGRKYNPRLYKYNKTFCGLFKLQNKVIGPDGELYKCEHHVGQEDKIIGNITTGLFYNDYLMRFIKNEPLEICKKCKIFPICLGGCPAQKQDLPEGDSCFYSEYYIRHLLDRYINES